MRPVGADADTHPAAQERRAGGKRGSGLGQNHFFRLKMISMVIATVKITAHTAG